MKAAVTVLKGSTPLRAGVTYMAASSWMCHFYREINTFLHTHIFTHIPSYLFVFDEELKHERI